MSLIRKKTCRSLKLLTSLALLFGVRRSRDKLTSRQKTSRLFQACERASMSPEHVELTLKDMNALKSASASSESQVPAMPINLPCRLDSTRGPQLEQFIWGRWLVTATLLRRELHNGGIASSGDHISQDAEHVAARVYLQSQNPEKFL